MKDNLAVENLLTSILGNTIYLANFYNFRINNPKLNFAQAMQVFSSKPNATVCKSFDEWNYLKRRIIKGEKALYYINEDNPNRKNYVFDISQTYGVEYPPQTYDKRENLVEDVNKLCFIEYNSFENNYKFLIQAIRQYNTENLYSQENELEQKFFERYIAIFVNATFNNSIEIPETIDFEDIDLERKIDILANAEEVAKEISQNILDEIDNAQDYKEMRAENRVKQDLSIKEEIENFYAKHRVKQIWNSGTRAPKKSQTEQVSIFNDVGNYNALSNANSRPSEQPETTVAKNTESNSDNIIYGAFERRTSVYDNNGRDNSSPNNLLTLTNYVLTEQDFEDLGGAKTKFKNNINAIRLIKQLDEENRNANKEEQKILAKYVGWGGLPQAFDKDNQSWDKEYNELKSLLSEKEYETAKASTLTAHFTNKTIIDGIYSALTQMGLKNGKILEPATGTGNFIGLLPSTFNKNDVCGIEIDNLTGKIAQNLYPESNIQIKGFEDTTFKNNEFDAVITNVPFGAYKVYDRDYNKHNFFIHDYFIAKSIDKIRPNGICAVITTKGTMDKANSSFRQYIADRATLLGAIRLPNNAFLENAGTKVTSDILFFQKRPNIISSQDGWINIGTNENGIPINNYFIENPNMLLGTMKMGANMYGSENETYLEPDERPLKEALAEIIQFLPKNIYHEQERVTQRDIEDDIIPADLNVRNFCYAVIDSQIFMRVDDKMVKQKIAKTNLDRFIQMIAIRSQVRQMLEAQISNCTDEELKTHQTKLNNIYDRFVKKYGYLNSKFNRNLFREDADFALLVALENYDESKKQATKTDIFSKRTIRIHEQVKTANNSFEALEISKNELGKVDLKYIEKITGFTYEKIINDLQNVIYKNPLAEDMASPEEDVNYLGWETADEYLSGNVKHKLKIAKLAAENNPIYKQNVDALLQAQPEPLTASEISVRLGATWIDKVFYEQFLIEKFKIEGYSKSEIEVKYNHFDGSWGVSAPPYCKYGIETTSIYGTKRMNAFKIAEHCLNLKTANIYDIIEDGETKRRVLNKAETILAREKQRKLEQEFKDWIFDNQERRNYLVDKYNDIFNNTKLQNFNGDYLTFPEMNPCIELKKHQKDAVARIITSGNTLLHHVVGAGKTYEIAAAAMKLRQYGLAHKPMIVVPNHLVMQWTREFKNLYPNANVLMATKKDLEKTNRLKFVSRVATGDWDAVIIASSSFEKIPLSQERQERKIKEELSAIEETLLNAKSESNRLTIKMLEKAKRSKEAVLKKLTDGTNKDNLIKFEDLGVDYLFVDEAHKYKNKFIFTKMNNVAGISKAMSLRATDLDLKCEYINELHKSNKGVVFATGTPISNSMVEMFTMQSYMQRDVLKQVGMNYFDGWAATFGETQTALELAPSGNGYRTRTRFAKFTNLPELMKMYRSFADVKTAEMLNLPTPKANKITITAKPSDEILRLNEEISQRADAINAGGIDPTVDNMLKITNDGKKLALDPRCFDAFAIDDLNNKVNLCIKNVKDIWDKTKDNKSTQIIFCDLSTPKYAFEDYNPNENFDIYNDIKYKLVEMGIPQEEIRFVHEANTDLQKQSLFDEVRNGNVRVLLGSTEKCGAGTNIQDKLIALHHLDTPYRPSDLEQREGRIVRQGNSNEEVFIYTYVTERTFDSYSYQILENKQKFISQINNGSLTIREASDIDEATLSYAEIKAITTANPKIKEKMELEQEIARLRTLEGQYKSNKYYLQDQISKELPKRIAFTEDNISNLEHDIVLRDNNKTQDFSIKIGNKLFIERNEAGTTLLNIVNSNRYNNQVIGQICGFNIIPLPVDNFFENRRLQLVGQGKYVVEISTSNVGSITRIENFIKDLETRIDANKILKADLLKQLESAKSEVLKPFEHIEKINELSSRLAELDAELDLNKEETEIVIDEYETETSSPSPKEQEQKIEIEIE